MYTPNHHNQDKNLATIPQSFRVPLCNPSLLVPPTPCPGHTILLPVVIDGLAFLWIIHQEQRKRLLFIWPLSLSVLGDASSLPCTAAPVHCWVASHCRHVPPADGLSVASRLGPLQIRPLGTFMGKSLWTYSFIPLAQRGRFESLRPQGSVHSHGSPSKCIKQKAEAGGEARRGRKETQI